jgi:hypothetical protein
MTKSGQSMTVPHGFGAMMRFTGNLVASDWVEILTAVKTKTGERGVVAKTNSCAVAMLIEEAKRLASLLRQLAKVPAMSNPHEFGNLAAVFVIVAEKVEDASATIH